MIEQLPEVEVERHVLEVPNVTCVKPYKAGMLLAGELRVARTCRADRQTRSMIWLLAAVAAWCVVPLPLAVAVGRSLRQSSPEHVPARLVEALAA